MKKATEHKELKFTSVFWKYIAALKDGARYIQSVGGTRCFIGTQRVETESDGYIPISELKPGDTVKSYNETTKEDEYNTVLKVMEYDNTKPTVNIKLKSGKEITCNTDHKFYYEGEWTEIGKILELCLALRI